MNNKNKKMRNALCIQAAKGAGRMTMKATISILPPNQAPPGSFPRNPVEGAGDQNCVLDREQSIRGYCLGDCRPVPCWQYNSGRGGQSLPSLGSPAGQCQTVHSKHRKNGQCNFIVPGALKKTNQGKCLLNV